MTLRPHKNDRKTLMKSAVRTVSIFAATAISLAACGGSGDQSGDSSPDTTVPAAAVNLADVCPETIVLQTDWNPEAEHGFLYHLVGPNYTVDAERARVRGDLVVDGGSTGVQVEVRGGGAAIGWAQVTAALYQDPDILLGFVGTDQALENSDTFPTVGVVATFNINPQIIMWDPDTYPDVTKIADLKDTDARVVYRDGLAYMDYLVSTGQLSKDQVDATYDGSPATFVAAGGKVAQQGFGTSEPYYYENVVSQWRKPVRYQYIHETGWTPYAQSLAGTPETIATQEACLRKLVPIIQQSQIDYLRNPETTNALILDLVDRYNNGWSYDAGQASAAVEKMLSDKIVSDSPDGTLGSFDLGRITSFIEQATPVLEQSGSKIKAGVTAGDLVTNEFIDPSISLG